MVKKANELLKPHGIAHAYTYFLMELYQEDGLTQAQIHKRVGIEQPTAVRTLDRMERDGFIARSQSPLDRRAMLIKLTDKGKQCKEIIENCAGQLNKIGLKGFKAKEITELNKLIERIIFNFGE